MGYELEQLKEFIRSELKKGYAVDTVKTTLASSGFSRSQIKKAFATLHKKEKITKKPEFIPSVTVKKPKGPGLFSGWFKHKPKSIKPKKVVKKPVKKIAKPKKPKKKGPGIFSRFFFKEVKPKQVKKTLPKLKPIPKKIVKPKKPTGPGLFSRLFKPKSIKPEVKKQIIIKPAPKPKPIKPKGPGIFKPITDIFKLIGKILAAILYKLTHPRKPAPITKKVSKKRMSHLSPPFLAFYLIMFFIVIGLIVYFFPATCITEECFVGKANKCESATYRNVIGGTTLHYETNDCYLIKTVMKMSKDEPEIMQNRFLGKSMTCSYNEGDFDPLYINTISAHLDTCEGELREEILKVIL